LYLWNEIVADRIIPALSFIFKTTFFRKLTGTILLVKNALQFKLITILLYEHETKEFPYGHRLKYFAKTSQVDFLMIHDVKGTVVPVNVPFDVALLHHYRI